jgi:endo-1,4-beta-mannosidase
MFVLYDTFNSRIVSRHRSIEAATLANKKLQREIKRNNGQSSYLPTTIKRIDSGELVDLTDSEYHWQLYCDHNR